MAGRHLLCFPLVKAAAMLCNTDRTSHCQALEIQRSNTVLLGVAAGICAPSTSSLVGAVAQVVSDEDLACTSLSVVTVYSHWLTVSTDSQATAELALCMLCC